MPRVITVQTTISPRSICLVASDRTLVDSAIATWLADIPSKCAKAEMPTLRTFAGHSSVLRFIRTTNSAVVWVLIVTEFERDHITRILRDIALLNADDNHLRIRALVLMAGSHAPSTAVAYRQLGADVCRLDLADAERAVGDLVWMAAHPQDDLATLQLLYPSPGRIRIRLIGPVDSVDIPIDEAITKLVEHLACNPGWHNKKALAEELGVGLETPTVYVERFRKSYDEVRRSAGEARTGKQVLVSAKLGVRWGYRLRAHIVK